MNLIDKTINIFAPSWGVKRSQARHVLNAYESAQPSRLRKRKGDTNSGDRNMEQAGGTLRSQARHLDENHDISKGILDVMVTNIVGPRGIGVEPQPRTLTGEIDKKLSKQLVVLWDDFCRKPEVTGEMSMARAERLACRSWLRDGEVFAKLIAGKVKTLDHLTRVPLSIELLESDFVPHDLNNEKKGIVQGVERSQWGRPRAYHVFKTHPGAVGWRHSTDTKRITADKMLHPKMTSRIGQARGTTIFASVFTRLDDLKDYEESERVAARISAAMAGYIKKGTPDMYIPQVNADGTLVEDEREFSFAPGMMFDNLLAGEDVGTMESNRPSALLQPFRDSMLRAVAGGTGSGYSSISKDFSGSYSSQRQELVEQYGSYGVLTDDFVSMFTEPIYRVFIDMCLASGLIEAPTTLDKDTLYDAEYRGQSMPWIDPKKEADANEKLVKAGFESRTGVIRSRGKDPDKVTRQIEKERNEAADMGLVFSSEEPKEVKADGKELVPDSEQGK